VSPISQLDSRAEALTYAAGDVIAYRAPLGTTAPTPFADLTSPWKCAGWIDVAGYIFKLNETLKEVMAAGTLSPIRTIISARTKSFEATFLEALNPVVVSLYDDVPLATLLPVSPATKVTYTLPETPTDNRYAFVFYTVDNDKRLWSFCPNGKVTARGNDQAQQGDVTMLQMTITLYPDMIGSVRAAIQKTVDYGAADLTAYE
jgi:hypothetical protein